MNEAQRLPYLALTWVDTPKFGYLAMCHMCRYACWSGSCQDAELDCEHKRYVVADQAQDRWQGGDCWGFRPRYARVDCVDVLGILLRGEWPDWETVPELKRRLRAK